MTRLVLPPVLAKPENKLPKDFIALLYENILARLYRILEVMLDIFRTLLDTLFPYPNAVRLITPLTTEQFLRHYTPTAHKKFTALSTYHHPYIRAAITANKFHNSLHAANLLGSLLSHYHHTHHKNAQVLYIPIPLSKQRLKDRGFNQVERVLSCSSGIHYEQVLERVKETVPQTLLGKNERLQNMVEAFAVPAHITRFSHTTLIIVDDVVTTGATLEAAKRALAAHTDKNCSIICLALAH